MKFYILFWTVCLATSAVSFAIITLIVTWRGLGEIRELIKRLVGDDQDS